MDALLHIAFQTNYNTINSLISTCKYYSAYPNIWKLACDVKFPDKPYFDFWTSKENYLVHERKNFNIIIHFSAWLYDNYIWSCICEERSIMRRLSTVNYTEFIVEAQFVLITQNFRGGIYIVGQYSTHKSAMESIQKDQLRKREIDDYCFHGFAKQYTYLIIDLKYMVPFFSNIKSRKNQCGISPGTYYHGTPDNPIVF